MTRGAIGQLLDVIVGHEASTELELVRRPENDLLPVIRRVYGIDPHTAQEMIAGLAPDSTPNLAFATVPLGLTCLGG